MRYLDEVIDLYGPHCDAGVFASRGQIYAVLRELGESDFIGGTVALDNHKKPQDCEPTANRAAIAVWWGGGSPSAARAAQAGA